MNLSKQIFRAGQHVQRARIHFDIWWLYAGPSCDQYIDAMRKFSQFYNFDEHAHFISYVIYIYGLFEKRTDTINLYNIANKSKPNEAVDQLLSEAEFIVSKIKLLRHKAFAHRDNVVPYNDVFESANVTPDELKDITEVAIRIANLLSVEHGVSEITFDNIYSQQAEAILQILRAR